MCIFLFHFYFLIYSGCNILSVRPIIYWKLPKSQTSIQDFDRCKMHIDIPYKYTYRTSRTCTCTGTHTTMPNITKPTERRKEKTRRKKITRKSNWIESIQKSCSIESMCRLSFFAFSFYIVEYSHLQYSSMAFALYLLYIRIVLYRYIYIKIYISI